MTHKEKINLATKQLEQNRKLSMDNISFRHLFFMEFDQQLAVCKRDWNKKGKS